MTQSLPAQSPLDPGLAFWGANIVRMKDAGMTWPGFSYSDAELARFRTLGAPVGAWTYQFFTWLTAAFFIPLAAVFVGLMIWLLSALYPDTSKTPASVFVCLLACVSLVSIGWGVPFSMRLAARIMGRRVDFSGIEPQAGDEALAAKIRFQIRRMTAIMCGVFIPGCLLWIAWDIDAGPIITVVKIGAIVLMFVSTWVAQRRPS
jgi:hypothetical protein